jgi:dual specificity phosphatase 3
MGGMPLPRVEVANVQFVTSQLLVGGDLSEDPRRATEQLAELIELGVTHVVDCRFEWSDEELFARSAPWVQYLHTGIDDAGQMVPARWFDEVAEFALEAMQDERARVLAHCHMGINRGPSAGYAILLAQGWDPIEALDAIRSVRPVAIIDYARDALRWQHLRRGSKEALAVDLCRLETWRRENYLDIQDVLRRIRGDGWF